ncbi:probable pseudouridine-5'-phosphatase isoform X2 [Dermacentor albipictus]|uniref:probable pseudouridine-5'-phosphatase isoform X2 n=1 Tax=Dermacentor albipictus TaxID=60249 RepID=UPI0031FBF6CB
MTAILARMRLVDAVAITCARLLLRRGMPFHRAPGTAGRMREVARLRTRTSGCNATASSSSIPRSQGAHRLVLHLQARGFPMTNGISSKPALFDLRQPRHNELLILFRHVYCSGSSHSASKRGDTGAAAGAERLLRHLHAHGIPMAVATSSTPASFALKMTQHQDIVDLFDHVVCSGGEARVKRGKPHPEIFLVAASKFVETPPSEKVLVFEDSPMGVTAALSAGMQVVMVPDPHIDEEIRRRATLCIVSLTEFKPELFGLPSFNTFPQKS